MNDTETEPVARILEDGVYTLNTAMQLLKLKKSCLNREIREGRLRVSKRANRYFILGKWLREWIEGGERTKKDAGE